MRAHRWTGSWLTVLLVSLPVLGGCGYSEEEWQAQLDKYEKLGKQHGELQRELDEAKARIDELTKQLESMGVKLDQEGSEKQALAEDLEAKRKALAEYQQRAAMLERIKARFELLRKKLQKMTDLGLKVSIRRNRMVISLPGDVLFEAGEDELSDKGEQILLQVAQVIASDDSLSKRHYQVAGHTDNQPLRRTAPKFKDNWGLSVMRARQVLVFLVGEEGKGGGLDPKRWSAAGYGDTDPIAGNASPGGRQKNRRVELTVMPDVEEMLDLQSLAGKD
jgi:chemotaxis protein MotB